VRPIPLFRPLISDEAVAAAIGALESGWIGAGPLVERFEEEFAALVGADHCVAVESGTAALHLALHVLDLAPGTEVVTTPLTWVATHHAILYERCVPVLADIDPTTGGIDVPSARARVGDRTGAILVMHYGGYPCDLDALAAVADEAAVPLVEDCAHAVGASYGGRPVGGGANLQCFSFGPTKNLTAADGGAIVTGDAAQAERLRRLRSLGVGRSTSRRMDEDATAYREDYGITELGFRYEMSDLHAAIGLGQLPHLASENARRREIAAVYEEGLSAVPGLELLRQREPGRASAHHLFAVLAEDRRGLAAALRGRGIDTGVHFPPNELVPADPEKVPNALRFAERTLSLPLHPGLDDEDVETVIAAVRAGW
jgi:perosamine synthetase